jgi:hypothetical protein
VLSMKLRPLVKRLVMLLLVRLVFSSSIPDCLLGRRILSLESRKPYLVPRGRQLFTSKSKVLLVIDAGSAGMRRRVSIPRIVDRISPTFMMIQGGRCLMYLLGILTSYCSRSTTSTVATHSTFLSTNHMVQYPHNLMVHKKDSGLLLSIFLCRLTGSLSFQERIFFFRKL